MESASQASRTRYQMAGQWRRLASVTGPPDRFLAEPSAQTRLPRWTSPLTQWVRKDAIELLEEVSPVDRSDTGHVVVSDDGVDREAGLPDRKRPLPPPRPAPYFLGVLFLPGGTWGAAGEVGIDFFTTCSGPWIGSLKRGPAPGTVGWPLSAATPAPIRSARPSTATAMDIRIGRVSSAWPNPRSISRRAFSISTSLSGVRAGSVSYTHLR